MLLITQCAFLLRRTHTRRVLQVPALSNASAGLTDVGRVLDRGLSYYIDFSVFYSILLYYIVANLIAIV